MICGKLLKNELESFSKEFLKELPIEICGLIPGISQSEIQREPQNSILNEICRNSENMSTEIHRKNPRAIIK